MNSKLQLSINNKFIFPKLFIYLVGILASFLIAAALSSTTLLRQFESKTIDFRFRMRGQHPPNSDLALVLIDEPTRAAIGNDLYSREIFAILAYGLNAMGASVIGMDFRFEEQRIAAADSLLADVAEELTNLVHGYYFPKLYEYTDPFYEDTLSIMLQKHSLKMKPDRGVSLYQADEVVLPFPELLQTSHHLGHINFIIDGLTGAVRKLPLFISYKNSHYPCLAFEMIRHFWNLTEKQIEIKPDKIVLFPSGQPSINIPISDRGEYLINYTSEFTAYQNSCSFLDVFEQCQEVLNQDSVTAQNSIFKDKIVLVGSIIGDDMFETPFSVNYPGVLIHAAVINNILQRQFLSKVNQSLQFFIFIFSGVVLLFIFTKLRMPYKIAGGCAVLLIYLFLTGHVFSSHGLILPIMQVGIFFLLSIAFVTVYDYFYLVKMNRILIEKARQRSEKLKELEQRLHQFAYSTPYVKIFIPFIRLQKQFILPHTIETNGDFLKELSAFQKGLQAKNLLPINMNQINKLVFDINLLWENYSAYLMKNDMNESVPIEKLRKIGAEIYQNFGIANTFNRLFQLDLKSFYLNFVLDDMQIPWSWAFDSKLNSFICEQFPLSISFAIERDLKFNSPGNSTRESTPLSKEKECVLLYGDWKNHPSKELKYTASEIKAIGEKISKSGVGVKKICHDVEKFISTLEECIDKRSDIRIIHYSGHAEEDYLDVGEYQYLPPGILKETRNLFFDSRPLVFLNACRSGQLKYAWEKSNNLATEFLACGAAACVVTFLDVSEVSAKNFALRFYDYYIGKRLAVAEALRLTRTDLGQKKYCAPFDPDYDITRYFYNLYGDPGLRY